MEIFRSENKCTFFIDDSTGVLEGYYYKTKGNLFVDAFKNGDCLTLIGELDYFYDEICVNIHRLEIVKDLDNEMFIY